MAPLIVQAVATLIARAVVGWRDAARIGIVVVYADDIGGRAFPSIVPDNWSCWIECLREMKQRLHVMPLRFDCRQVGHAPRFVERHPCDDARVTVVAIDYRGPFTGESID